MLRYVVIGVGVVASLVGGYFIKRSFGPLFGGTGGEDREPASFPPVSRLRKPRRPRFEEPTADGERFYQPDGQA